MNADGSGQRNLTRTRGWHERWAAWSLGPPPSASARGVGRKHPGSEEAAPTPPWRSGGGSSGVRRVVYQRDVPGQELLVGRVKHSDVDMRSATVGGGNRTFEPESSRAISANAAAPTWAVTVWPCLPKNNEGPSDGSAVCAEDPSLEDVTCADLRPTRRGEAPRWNGPAPSPRVGWQAAGVPVAVSVSAPAVVAATTTHARIRSSIAAQDSAAKTRYTVALAVSPRSPPAAISRTSRTGTPGLCAVGTTVARSSPARPSGSCGPSSCSAVSHSQETAARERTTSESISKTTWAANNAVI